VIVRNLEQMVGTERDVAAETWRSRRLLLSSDGMGFSLHDTVMETGTETTMWYRNHLEAVYCIEGEGEVEVLATGERHVITAGTMYALDEHDHHVMRVKERMRMVCVFNPPCTGREVHDDEGVYPLLVDDPEPGRKTA
jgi:L-ectoine synthase